MPLNQMPCRRNRNMTVRRGFCVVVFFAAVISTALPVSAQPAAPTPAPAPVPLILLTQSKGFEHDVVKRKGNDPSLVEKTFSALADKTHLFTVDATKDAATITPEKLKTTKIIVFYTTGDIPLDVAAFDQWI